MQNDDDDGKGKRHELDNERQPSIVFLSLAPVFLELTFTALWLQMDQMHIKSDNETHWVQCFAVHRRDQGRKKNGIHRPQTPVRGSGNEEETRIERGSRVTRSSVSVSSGCKNGRRREKAGRTKGDGMQEGKRKKSASITEKGTRKSRDAIAPMICHENSAAASSLPPPASSSPSSRLLILSHSTK